MTGMEEWFDEQLNKPVELEKSLMGVVKFAPAEREEATTVKAGLNTTRCSDLDHTHVLIKLDIPGGAKEVHIRFKVDSSTVKFGHMVAEWVRYGLQPKPVFLNPLLPPEKW